MRITEVHIKGFRSLQDVKVDLADYACLIGKNDCGKSSFLRALQMLFEPETPMTTEDVCKCQENDVCFVQAPWRIAHQANM